MRKSSSESFPHTSSSLLLLLCACRARSLPCRVRTLLLSWAAGVTAHLSSGCCWRGLVAPRHRVGPDRRLPVWRDSHKLGISSQSFPAVLPASSVPNFSSITPESCQGAGPALTTRGRRSVLRGTATRTRCQASAGSYPRGDRGTSCCHCCHPPRPLKSRPSPTHQLHGGTFTAELGDPRPPPSSPPHATALVLGEEGRSPLRLTKAPGKKEVGTGPDSKEHRSSQACSGVPRSAVAVCGASRAGRAARVWLSQIRVRIPDPRSDQESCAPVPSCSLQSCPVRNSRQKEGVVSCFLPPARISEPKLMLGAHSKHSAEPRFPLR